MFLKTKKNARNYFFFFDNYLDFVLNNLFDLFIFDKITNNVSYDLFV